MARKRKRSTRRKASARSTAPARRRSRRRSYRRNPPKFSVKSTVRTLQNGAIGAVAIIAGEVGAAQAGALLKLPVGGPAGIAGALGVAAAIGVAGDMVFKGKHKHLAEYAVAGALIGPIKEIIKPMLPDTVAGLLAYPQGFSAYPQGRDLGMVPEIGDEGYFGEDGFDDFD